jgi:hypothetical protein
MKVPQTHKDGDGKTLTTNPTFSLQQLPPLPLAQFNRVDTLTCAVAAVAGLTKSEHDLP